MLVSDSRLEKLFNKVAKIREYCQPNSGVPQVCPISVEDIQAAVERVCQVNIEKNSVLSTGLFLHSMLLRYDNGKCIILLREDLTESVKRYAAVKELAHIFLDEKEDWSTDGMKTISGLIELRLLERAGNGEHEPSNQVIIAEHLAEIAAVELLYPPQKRLEDRVLLEGSRVSYRKLAAKYSVPIRAVRFAHMRWYCEIREKFM